MNLILSTVILSITITINVNSQPLADSKNGFVNFLVEMINPSFRRHRARIRPFTNQFGSPVINIRSGRGLLKTCKTNL